MGSVIIHEKRFIDADGAVHLQRVVDCPLRKRLRAIDACFTCGRGGDIQLEPHLGRTSIECTVAPTERRFDIAARRIVREDRERAEAVQDIAVLDLVSVSPKTPFEFVDRAFREYSVEAMAVVDPNGTALGIITPHDLVARAGHASVASQLMSPDPATIAGTAPIATAVEAMIRANTTHLLVLGWGGAVIGLVSALALLRRAASEPAA